MVSVLCEAFLCAHRTTNLWTAIGCIPLVLFGASCMASDPAEDHGAIDAGTDDDAGCRCTGPGDWAAGDYPPDLHAQTYLPLTGVTGQEGAVRGSKVHVPPGYEPS